MGTKKVTFQIAMDNDQPGPVVTGTQIDYGLVLHLEPSPPKYRPANWVISEPFTGFRVTEAITRKGCKVRFAEYVAKFEKNGADFYSELLVRRNAELKKRGLYVVKHGRRFVTVSIPGSEVCGG
jgi:hypothetical protein